MKVVTGPQMAEIDRKTIDELGIPGVVLMENAARSLCRVLLERVGLPKSASVLVICGTGNNGGDGFCAARILAGLGFHVEVVLVGSPEKLRRDALTNYKSALKYGVDVLTIESKEDMRLFSGMLSGCDWIIDAVFGTGLSGRIEGLASEVLSITACSGKRCIAADIPSGVSSDTGEVLGEVIPADVTVTFGLPKFGHFIFPGAKYTGKLVVADIGFKKEDLESEEIKTEITSPGFVKKWLKPIQLDAYKSSRGVLAVVGGCRHLLGAPLIASQAALRAGCGYVRTFIPRSLELAAKATFPELVTFGLADMGEGFFDKNAFNEFKSNLDKASAVAAGPGLGTGEGASLFIKEILKDLKIPVVFDADALNIIAAEDGVRFSDNSCVVLTPHAGEAARLLGVSTGEILAAPLWAIRELVRKYNCTVLLKAPNTIIMSPDGRININTTGNPSLAIMGSGDILTGIIGSFLAGGVAAFESAAAGAYIHGLASDYASVSIASEGIMPHEISSFIPNAVERVRKNEVVEKISRIF